MLLIHDLAEARLGDPIGESNSEAEQEVLWQYGAFATYRDVADLWRIPKLFQEFAECQTIDAKVAQDLDRLQFVLQARLYSDGMPARERVECEKTGDKLKTATVRAIAELLRDYPAPRRFKSATVTY
jgi:5'-deoxynucleotidase YfbR-like HD superfamily hydrolase